MDPSIKVLKISPVTGNWVLKIGLFEFLVRECMLEDCQDIGKNS